MDVVGKTVVNFQATERSEMPKGKINICFQSFSH